MKVGFYTQFCEYIVWENDKLRLNHDENNGPIKIDTLSYSSVLYELLTLLI